MMESLHGEDSVHAHTLRTTLGEHKQHFSNLVVGFTPLAQYPFSLFLSIIQDKIERLNKDLQ